jgi:hypothetical protein
VSAVGPGRGPSPPLGHRETSDPLNPADVGEPSPTVRGNRPRGVTSTNPTGGGPCEVDRSQAQDAGLETGSPSASRFAQFDAVAVERDSDSIADREYAMAVARCLLRAGSRAFEGMLDRFTRPPLDLQERMSQQSLIESERVMGKARES